MYGNNSWYYKRPRLRTKDKSPAETTSESMKHSARAFPYSVIFSSRRGHQVHNAVLRILQSWSRKQFFRLKSQMNGNFKLNNCYTMELKLNLFSRSLYSRNKLYFMPWRNSLWKMKNRWGISSNVIWRENMLGYLSADIICSDRKSVV